jgi:ubiquinone/menaquinone biosynthesis C-methylase UbiE
MYLKKYKLLFFSIIIFIIILFLYKKIFVNYEHFEDKFDSFEKYDEIYDNEFVNLYEIIYRDYTDIDYDTNIFYSKCFNNNSNDINILVAGSGVGKLCNKIKEKYDNVVGIDISENMLMKAQYTYPHIKFVRGNLNKEKIFNKESFSHIYIDERTLYYNDFENIKKIIYNCNFWLKDNGLLIIPIYDPDKLQLAARYYSSKYIDDKGNIHGFTYLNDFSHDCYYIKDEENKDIFYYYDKIIFDTGEKRIKKTTFYIPPKEKIYELIFKNGFDLIYIEKIRIQIVGGYDLAIFKKKLQKTTVEELEKKITNL